MLLFYVICGVLIFAVSGLLLQFNRFAIYRRRIIRHFANTTKHTFILSKSQEKHIKRCFYKGVSIQICIEQF